MLYPLRDEGITGFSRPSLWSMTSSQHNASTRSGKKFSTNHDHSPLFKHENGA